MNISPLLVSPLEAFQSVRPSVAVSPTAEVPLGDETTAVSVLRLVSLSMGSEDCVFRYQASGLFCLCLLKGRKKGLMNLFKLGLELQDKSDFCF